MTDAAYTRALGPRAARCACAALLLALGACSRTEPPPPPSADPQPRSPSQAPSKGSKGTEVIRFGSSDPVPVAELARHEDAQVVEVVDPYEDQPVRFEAVPARALLDDQFGKAWRKADEVVFECADGYRAAVPASRLLEHEAYFALARVGAEFVIEKPVAETVKRTQLSPAYLIWENRNDALIRAEGDWGWPYQIVGVTLADSALERYERMAPAPDAGTNQELGAQVQRGFHAFRRYCSRCHAINGVGGDVGPELNYPVSVSEYMQPEWLRRWIDAPRSVRHGTPMPGLPPGVTDREQTLDDLVAYLHAMAGRKLPPHGGD